MKPLNRDATSLIEAAAREAADEPSAADRTRVKRSLAARLAIGAGASAGTVGVGTAKAAKLALLTKLLLPTATLGTVAAAGGYYGYQAYHADAASVSQAARAPEARAREATVPSPGAHSTPPQAQAPSLTVLEPGAPADNGLHAESATRAPAPAGPGAAARGSTPTGTRLSTWVRTSS